MSASAATSGTGSRATAHMTIAGGPAYADATTPVIDPATAQPFAAAPDCSIEQLEEAVRSAAEAFRSWRRSTDDERQAALRRIAAVVAANREDLAQLLTHEQ